MPGAVIGDRCNFGQNVNVDGNVVIGNNVKVQNNVSIYSAPPLRMMSFWGHPAC